MTAQTNALAESEIGLYKAELIEPNKPWRTTEDVELRTFEWIHWFNHRRLHSSIGDIPPIEFEAAYYLGLRSAADGHNGSIGGPGSGATPALNEALRGSEGLVFGADPRSVRSRSGSSVATLSDAQHDNGRGEVGGYPLIIETQAPESP